MNTILKYGNDIEKARNNESTQKETLNQLYEKIDKNKGATLKYLINHPEEIWEEKNDFEKAIQYKEEDH